MVASHVQMAAYHPSEVPSAASRDDPSVVAHPYPSAAHPSASGDGRKQRAVRQFHVPSVAASSQQLALQDHGLDLPNLAKTTERLSAVSPLLPMN